MQGRTGTLQILQFYLLSSLLLYVSILISCVHSRPHFLPLFQFIFLHFCFVVCFSFLLGPSSSSCHLAFLLFCCFIVFQLYIIVSIDKGWLSLFLGTELPIGRTLSRLCHDYRKNYFPNGLTLFPIDGGSSLSRNIKNFTHTHILPQSSVMDKLFEIGP